MKAVFDRITADHLFFCYLSQEARADINARVEAEQSAIVSFERDNGEVIFAVVLDYDAGEYLHVREAGGHFPGLYKTLDVFCRAVALNMKKSFVSFATAISGVEGLAARAGYARDKSGDFVKAVKA